MSRRLTLKTLSKNRPADLRLASVVAVAVALLGVYVMVRAHAAGAPTPNANLPALPAGQAWNLAFDDEFNGTALDTSVWQVGEPWNAAPGYDSGPDSYCPLPNTGAVQETGGNLVFHDTAGANPSNKPLLGCDVQSRKGYDTFTNGYIEARVQVPGGAGLWPAFWLLGNGTGAQGWPGTGEIDMFEFVNNGTDNGVPFFTVHWGGACDSGHCQATYQWPPAVSQYTGWHTFGMLRTSTALKMYIDGQYAYQITNTTVSNNGGNLPVPASPVFNDPMHIRFDMTAGGWAKNPNQADQPGDYLVDYVRVWQAGTAGTATPTPTPTATTTPTPTPGVVTGDFTGDSKVNVFDLSYLLGHWSSNDAKADLNHDGTVDIHDLSALLTHWTG